MFRICAILLLELKEKIERKLKERNIRRTLRDASSSLELPSVQASIQVQLFYQMHHPVFVYGWQITVEDIVIKLIISTILDKFEN